MVKICMIIYCYERMGAFLRTEWLSLNNKKKKKDLADENVAHVVQN